MENEITVDELKEKIDKKKDIIILDVREEDELEYGKIQDSILIPMHEVQEKLNELSQDKEIICYCRSGNRSGFIASFLRNNGYNAKNLLGGILAWKKYDLSIIEY